MSRIHSLPVEQWDPEFRDAVKYADTTELQQRAMEIHAHAPHMAKAMFTWTGIAKAGQQLSSRLIELVRLRIAFHNQCRTCMAMRSQSAVDDGLTEGMVCSLEKPYEAPDLTAQEKAALAYADKFTTNHFAIDNDTFDDLRKVFTEAEIVELANWCAFYVGFGRLMAVYDMVEVLPEAFQSAEKVTPWTHEGVVVPGY
jgi:AhpD family alkylhydroperoxidase